MRGSLPVILAPGLGDTIERVSYGSFVHLMDPEGNKIELWEPNDVEYAKMGTITTK
ncbi:MAG TPA: hypothetical protein VNW95_17025 [Mucilaginibacter sp.]|nr:hypothetical protein [Mucilaginibacter sp.]